MRSSAARPGSASTRARAAASASVLTSPTSMPASPTTSGTALRVERDHRAAARHRFEQREPEALVERRTHQHRRAAVEERQLGRWKRPDQPHAGAGELRPVAGAQTAREHQLGRRQRAGEAREGRRQQLDVLAWLQRPEIGDERPRAETVTRPEGVERGAIGDRLEARARRRSERRAPWKRPPESAPARHPPRARRRRSRPRRG